MYNHAGSQGFPEVTQSLEALPGQTFWLLYSNSQLSQTTTYCHGAGLVQVLGRTLLGEPLYVYVYVHV
jgi:hypothetical protein